MGHRNIFHEKLTLEMERIQSARSRKYGHLIETLKTAEAFAKITPGRDVVTIEDLIRAQERQLMKNDELEAQSILADFEIACRDLNHWSENFYTNYNEDIELMMAEMEVAVCNIKVYSRKLYESMQMGNILPMHHANHEANQKVKAA